MTTNGKGENWPKFLREMQSLGPMLPDPGAGGSSIPILGRSRQQVRQLGFKNRKEMVEAMERDASVEEHKKELIDKWFEEAMTAYLPKWFYRLGAKWPRLFTALGFYVSMRRTQHKEPDWPQAYPCTICRVHYKFFAWFELKAARHVWQ